MIEQMRENVIFYLFLMLGIPGVIMMLSAILFKAIRLRHIRSCTAVTKGTVTKFSYRGEGNLAPVVSFEIDGKKYSKRRKFNGFKMVSRSGLPIPAKGDIWEDDKVYLNIRVGAVANMYDLAERIWPMGSEMDVYYNPKNPKISFVGKPIVPTLPSKVYFFTGLGFVMIPVVVFIVSKLTQ